MKLYCLSIAPSESDGEGEDHDEWFTSLEAAKRRRRELIRDNPGLVGHKFGRDFEIEEIIFAKLPQKALALAILNRRGYVAQRTVVVPSYIPSKELHDRLVHEDALAQLNDPHAWRQL